LRRLGHNSREHTPPHPAAQREREIAR
jgi:hypothetical protein